jgi:hypothetical protein
METCKPIGWPDYTELSPTDLVINQHLEHLDQASAAIEAAWGIGRLP